MQHILQNISVFCCIFSKMSFLYSVLKRSISFMIAENTTKTEEENTKLATHTAITSAPEVTPGASDAVIDQSSQSPAKLGVSPKKRVPTLRRRFVPYRFRSRRYYDWHNYIGAQNAYDNPRYQHLPPQPQPYAPGPGVAPAGYSADPYGYPGGYPNQPAGYQDQQYYEGDRRYGLRNPGFDNSYARRTGPLPMARRFRLRRPIRPTDTVPQLNYLEKVSKPGGGFEYRQVKLHHDDKGNVYYSRRGETENGTIVVRREKKYFKPKTYPYFPDNTQDHRYQQEPYYPQPGYPRPGYSYPQEPQQPNPLYPQPQHAYPQPGYPQPGYSPQQPYIPQPPYPQPQPQPYPPQPQPYPPPPQPPPQPQPYPQQHPYPQQQSYARQPLQYPLGGYIQPDSPNYLSETRGAALKFAKMRADQRGLTGKPQSQIVEKPSTVRTL